jgi:hypothetical protein
VITVLDSLVKVKDAATGELKRWEMPSGKPLAVKKNGSLVLTQLGKKLGYRVKGHLLTK